jgi:hypothetical protein
MKILCHHIYEYKKGLRNLVLHTLRADLLAVAIERLERGRIDYLVQPVNNNKVNIFFGNNECVDIIAGFGDKPLTEFTNEEDFILGIMLGYSRLEQCKRYNKRKRMRTIPIPHVENERLN